MDYDKTCIKSDVCDMAVCDYKACRHGFWMNNLKEKSGNLPEADSRNAVLGEVRARIADDLTKLKCGGMEHKTSGHIRCLKIIDEYIKEHFA